jgi:hypothetical protein
MKTGTLITIIYGLTLAVMATWLLIEHSACAQIHRENTELLRRLNEATEKLAENQRSDRAASSIDQVSEANRALSAADLSGAGGEMQQLRGEIAKLLEAHQQAESLREDSRQTRTALANRKNEDRAARRAANPSVSALQIIKAEYWTDNQRMDVTDELQDRVRGDNLKAVASNNLNGDPEFGQVKHLTIEYSIGGVTLTNEFREGEMVVIPPPFVIPPD